MSVAAKPAPSRHAAARSLSAAEGVWSDQRVERLKRLWLDDGLSAAQIGRQLGVSRNAVLGKIHRLGLSNRRPARPMRTVAPRPPRPRRPPPQAPLASRPRREAPARAEEVGPGLIARLEAMPAHVCHWPIGDPQAEAFAFCGRPARVDPYCDAHRQVAYRPGGPVRAEALLKFGAAA